MLLSRVHTHRSPFLPLLRTLHGRPVLCAAQLPPRIKLDDGDLQEKFLKGTGPGGQKINKTASAVQLKHLPTGIVIKCQTTRSRSQNRDIARRLLADRIEEREKGDESRTALKREAARKKKASKTKKARRKYKKLEQAENEAAEDGDRPSDDSGQPHEQPSANDRK